MPFRIYEILIFSSGLKDTCSTISLKFLISELFIFIMTSPVMIPASFAGL